MQALHERGEDKLNLVPLARFRVPLGGQEVELQQVEYVHADMPLLRLRIREGKRFTVFDIDPATARDLGTALCRWAHGQEATDHGEAGNGR